MSASAEKARQAVLAKYPGKTWENKVKKMPDFQVIAIYMRLKAQGKL